MLQKEKSVNVRETFLQRPRVDALLAEGLKKPSIVITAALGYGRTKAVEHFLQDRKERVLWFTFTRHDNITIYFWRNFLLAIGVCFPEFAEVMGEIGFPDSDEKFDVLRERFANEISEGERVVLVLDDYNVMYNRSIQIFFEKIIETEIKNLCLVIISSSANISTDADRILHISSQNLAFTKREAFDYLALCGVECPAEKIVQIHEDIQGWPLGISFFAEQYHQGNLVSDGADTQIPVISEFFENVYFSCFEEVFQLFLVRLSLFKTFCPELAEILNFGILKNTKDKLKQYPFIDYDSDQDVFRFKKFYQKLLETKQDLLSAEQKRQSYLLAGEHFSQHGMYCQAADSFFNGGDYNKFLYSLTKLPRRPVEKEYCEEMFKRIRSFPKSFCAQNHLDDFVRGFLHLNIGEFEAARNVFIDLLEKFEQETMDERKQLLMGEICLALSDISVWKRKEEFSYYYKKACEYLPEDSVVLDQELLFLGNNEAFFLKGDAPGMLDNMLATVDSIISYAESVKKENGNGYAWLYAAEAAYMTCDFDRAEECAAKALKAAFARNQHDIVCNTYKLLAKVALNKGEYAVCEKQMGKITGYADAVDIPELFEIRDCIENWFNIIIGSYDKLSGLATDHDFKWNNPDNVRSNLVYALYLMEKEEYQASKAIFAQIEKVLSQNRYWVLQAFTYVLKSICYFRTDDYDIAMEYFGKVYDMSYSNNIIMPFVEFGSAIHGVLGLAKKSPEYSFNVDWLDSIYEKSTAYETNLVRFLNERYKQKIGRKMQDESNLSVEELDILKMMSCGKMTEEIQNDVKCEVKNIIMDIYLKLGAVNKFDAIRIAKSQKYI